MSTIDQAFVQAFARRNRRTKMTTGATTPPIVQNVSEQQTHRPTTVESLAIDLVDPAKESLLRAEAAARQSVPTPHVKTASIQTTPVVTQPSVDTQIESLVSQFDTLRDVSSPIHFVNEDDFLANALGRSEAPAISEPPRTSVDYDQPYISASSRVETMLNSRVSTSEPSPKPLPFSQPAPQDRTAHANPPESKSIVFDSITRQRIDPVDPFANAPHIQTAVDPQSAPIKAAWEVDVFDVPSSVTELFFQEELFQTVAERLHDAVGEGLSSMMVTSAKAGEGRSTVAIGMAVAAAATGIRVALVDADLSEPTLVDDLRLDVDHGWREALLSGMPLSQVAVYSIEDNLTLIPLIHGTAESGASGSNPVRDGELAQLMQSLEQQFDLIVIDASSGDDSENSSGNPSTIDRLAALVDSAVIARDASRTDLATVNELSSRLRRGGLQGIGIVENFA